ncbi:MAG TPA: hypothetical protein VE868_00385 [Balneolaceae bacterium]|nr:hypothetical protein [Balneolaceae bacterium]
MCFSLKKHTASFIFIICLTTHCIYGQSLYTAKQIEKTGKILSTWLILSSKLKDKVAIQIWRYKGDYFFVRKYEYQNTERISLEQVHLKKEKGDTIITVDQFRHSPLEEKYIKKGDLLKPYTPNDPDPGNFYVFYRDPSTTVDIK